MEVSIFPKLSDLLKRFVEIRVHVDDIDATRAERFKNYQLSLVNNPAIPYYVIFATEQLGQPLVAVGTYTVLVVLAKMVGGLFWGRLADRYGHKRVLILVGFVSLLPYLLAYLSSIVHPLLMYGVFFSLGLSLDSKEVLVRNYLLDRSPKDSVPTFSALLNTMSAPTMVFPLLGALVISLASYKALFIVALAVTAGGVSAAFRLPEMLDEGIELIQT